jgi:hypothetical protein
MRSNVADAVADPGVADLGPETLSRSGATSLEISRSANDRNPGLWTGDFESVQHMLDEWESRVNGGFGSPLKIGAQQVRLYADKKMRLLQC